MVIKQNISSNKTSQKLTHLYELISSRPVCISLISSSWNTETIDFHLSPIEINNQNVRVLQIESAIYKGDVIMEKAYYALIKNMHLITMCAW